MRGAGLRFSPLPHTPQPSFPRSRESHPLRVTSHRHGRIAPTPVPPLPSPHGSRNLSPQLEQHESSCRRGRQPDPWRLGPHRWSEGAQGGLFPLCQIRLFLPRATASKRIKSPEAGECSAGGWRDTSAMDQMEQEATPIVVPAVAETQSGAPSVRPEPVEACPEGTRRTCTEDTHEGGLPRSLSLRSRRTPSATATLSLQANPNSGAASSSDAAPFERGVAAGASRRGLRRMRAL